MSSNTINLGLYSKLLRFIFLLLVGAMTLCRADSIFHLDQFPQGERPEAEPLHVQFIAQEATVQPGKPFWVAFVVTLDGGWHTYWKNPGETGIETSVDWFLPEGFQVSDLKFPVPERKEDKGIIYFGYEGTFTLLAEITPPENLEVGKDLEIGATLRWVACNDGNCLPGDTDPSLKLPTASTVPEKIKNHEELFKAARQRMPQEAWPIVAQRSGDIIELIVSAPHPINQAKTDFFPDKPNVLDYRHEVTMPQTSTETDKFVVVLKPDPHPEKPFNRVQGVLIVQHPQGNKVVTEAVEVDIPLNQVSNAVINEQLMPHYNGGLALALILALAGGALLNLMPCVLPVISFKVLSLVKMAGGSRKETLKHGALFALGVIVSFWVLAGMLLILQAYGRAVGWGFQLQDPLFVAVLASVLLMLALSLFGVFEIGTMFASWAGTKEHGAKQKTTGLLGSFLGGVLATAVATPCTGPFLGTAIGFAVTLPPMTSLLIFTAVGLGMSAPYLLLTAYPSLLKWLPKPGNWMIAFKQLMGFLMLGTVVWLSWVFAAQTSLFALFTMLVGFFFLSFAAWIYGIWGTPHTSKRLRLVTVGFTLAIVAMAASVIGSAATGTSREIAVTEWTGDVTAENIRDWKPFSKRTLDKLLADGKPVFVDFTAKWCLICQANGLVLDIVSVEDKFAEAGVVKLLADWTRADPEITAELAKFGRSGVPLYVLYLPGSEKPIVLPQVLTPDIVIEQLGKIINNK